MNTELINGTVTDFNQTLSSLAISIADVCPDSIIGNNINDIKKTINNKQNFTKFIDVFCIKVLKYKKEIDEGKDSFFLNKDYSADLTDCDGISDKLDLVLSLKNVWAKMKPDNKKIVIMNMQILCALAQMYFEFVYANMNK
jgi:hypothetical protein